MRDRRPLCRVSDVNAFRGDDCHCFEYTFLRQAQPRHRSHIQTRCRCAGGEKRVGAEVGSEKRWCVSEMQCRREKKSAVRVMLRYMNTGPLLHVTQHVISSLPTLNPSTPASPCFSHALRHCYRRREEHHRLVTPSMPPRHAFICFLTRLRHRFRHASIRPVYHSHATPRRACLP